MSMSRFQFTKNDVERLTTMTKDEIIAAYARSGEVTDWTSEIVDLKFVDFHVSNPFRADDDGELVAHYTAQLRDLDEVIYANLYIALSSKGPMGSF